MLVALSEQVIKSDKAHYYYNKMNPEKTVKKYNNYMTRESVRYTIELLTDALSQLYEED